MVRDRARRRAERGVSLVEYALVLSLLVVGTLSATRALEDNTSDEVDNQADCISTRPPPPSCQAAALTPTTGPPGPGDPGDPGVGGPGTTETATISDPPTVASGPAGAPAGTPYDVEVGYTFTDSTSAAIAQEVVTVRVEVTQSSFAGRVGQFFYVDCVTDDTGACTFAFDTRWGDADEVSVEVVAIGIDTPYEFTPPSAVLVGRP